MNCNSSSVNNSCKNLDRVTLDVLDDVYMNCLKLDENSDEESDSELNKSLLHFALNNSSFRDGRLVLPALWNDKVSSFLPNNYKISYSILQSLYKKLKNDPSKLSEYNDIFIDQLSNGVISEVFYDDVYDENISFLPHNAVYIVKMLRQRKLESYICLIFATGVRIICLIIRYLFLVLN